MKTQEECTYTAILQLSVWFFLTVSTVELKEWTISESPLTQNLTTKYCQEINLQHLEDVTSEELKQLTDYLEEKFTVASSIWLPIRQYRLEDFLWLDGKLHELKNMMPDPSPHEAMDCGRLQIEVSKDGKINSKLSNMWCGRQNFGFICQIKGSCPTGFTNYNCMFLKTYNVSFTYGCSMPNWFSSEYVCRVQQGGHLAVFPNTTLMDLLVGHMMVQMDKKSQCEYYWVGFTKTVWLSEKSGRHTEGTSSNGNNNLRRLQRERSMPLWFIGEPRSKRNCSILVQDGEVWGWKAAQCAEKHYIMCEIISDTLSKRLSIEPRKTSTSTPLNEYHAVSPPPKNAEACNQSELPQAEGKTMARRETCQCHSFKIALVSVVSVVVVVVVTVVSGIGLFIYKKKTKTNKRGSSTVTNEKGDIDQSIDDQSIDETANQPCINSKDSGICSNN